MDEKSRRLRRVNMFKREKRKSRELWISHPNVIFWRKVLKQINKLFVNTWKKTRR